MNDRTKEHTNERMKEGRKEGRKEWRKKPGPLERTRLRPRLFSAAAMIGEK
jgi:hypothetical protein